MRRHKRMGFVEVRRPHGAGHEWVRSTSKDREDGFHEVRRTQGGGHERGCCDAKSRKRSGKENLGLRGSVVLHNPRHGGEVETPDHAAQCRSQNATSLSLSLSRPSARIGDPLASSHFKSPQLNSLHTVPPHHSLITRFVNS